jgi:succinoglycan biosynthesis transport protein ExoP
VQGSSGAELRYVELSRELSLAEADLARAAARAGQLQGGIDTLAEGGASPVITDLRRQEAELNRRVAELSTLYGDRHPTMINARAELRDIQRSLARERQRLVEQVTTEREVAQARVDDLRGQLDRLEATLGRNTTAQVQLDQFESRSETTRRTYEDLLERFQRATEQQHLLRSPARIVTPARPPAKPDGRRSILVLGFTAMARSPPVSALPSHGRRSGASSIPATSSRPRPACRSTARSPRCSIERSCKTGRRMSWRR